MQCAWSLFGIVVASNYWSWCLKELVQVEALSNTCCPVSPLSLQYLSLPCTCTFPHHLLRQKPVSKTDPKYFFSHCEQFLFSAAWSVKSLCSLFLGMYFWFTFVNPVSHTSELNLGMRRRMFPLFFAVDRESLLVLSFIKPHRPNSLSCNFLTRFIIY